MLTFEVLGGNILKTLKMTHAKNTPQSSESQLCNLLDLLKI